MKRVERFKALYEGYTKSYGIVNVTGEKVDGMKVDSNFHMVHREMSESLWQDHLNGSCSLSILPIDEKMCCRWAAIDIDDYNGFGHREVAIAIGQQKLPFVVHRTKSGGGHIFVYFKKPVLVKNIRKKLMEIGACLGYAEEEFFPKQSKVNFEQGDTGNMLQLPYFDCEQTLRFAYDDKGEELIDFDKYLDFVESKKISAKEFLAIDVINIENEWEGAPPCIASILSRSVEQGSRNDTMFHIGVFLIKKHSKEGPWKDHMERINQQYFSPNLNTKELTSIMEQLDKKDYGYKCQQSPFKDFCQKSVCSQRRYGITGGDNIDLSGCVKMLSFPPIWFVNVDDQRIELTTDQFHSQEQFSKRVLEETNMVMNIYKGNEWRNKIRNLTKDIIEVEAPYETTKEGMLLSELKNFLDPNRARGNSKKDLSALDKNYYDVETNTIHFKLNTLMEWLRQRSFPETRRNAISNRLKELGAKSTRLDATIGGKRITTSVYILPATDELTEKLEVPEVVDEII